MNGNKIELNNMTKTMIISKISPKSKFKTRSRPSEAKMLKYLGSVITEDGKMDEELHSWINTHKHTLHWKNTHLVQKKYLQKLMRIYNIIFVPILTYNSKSEMTLLKRIPVRLSDTIRGQDIRDRLDVIHIKQKIRQNSLR